MEKKELYHLLKKENVKAFNQAVKGLTEYDLQNVNLRGRNLIGANLKYADLRGAYLANTNLKGVNMSFARLEGASMHRARISGTYFPKNVSASEILNSVNYGTRIRTADDDVHESDALFTTDS